MLERYLKSVLALFQRSICHPVSPGGLGTITSWRFKYHLSNFDTFRFTRFRVCDGCVSLVLLIQLHNKRNMTVFLIQYLSSSIDINHMQNQNAAQ